MVEGGDGLRPAGFQAARGGPIYVVMNVSIDGGRKARAARLPLNESTRPPIPAAEPIPASPGEHCWTTSVEALAAHWQAALGGFHTGAPPNR